MLQCGISREKKSNGNTKKTQQFSIKTISVGIIIENGKIYSWKCEQKKKNGAVIVQIRTQNMVTPGEWNEAYILHGRPRPKRNGEWKGMRCKPRFMCNANANNIGISFTKHHEPWVKNALTHEYRRGLTRDNALPSLFDIHISRRKQREIHIFSREVSFHYDNIVGLLLTLCWCCFCSERMCVREYERHWTRLTIYSCTFLCSLDLFSLLPAFSLSLSPSLEWHRTQRM